MAEFDLRMYMEHEHRDNLHSELQADGLFGAVKTRCIEIEEQCRGFPYIQHMSVVELLSEILDFIEMDGGKK